jgi:hypothetical protein
VRWRLRYKRISAGTIETPDDWQCGQTIELHLRPSDSYAKDNKLKAKKCAKWKKAYFNGDAGGISTNSTHVRVLK